jgi:TRAP-type C4-dicarboxylate transport system substrate-binding protein
VRKAAAVFCLVFLFALAGAGFAADKPWKLAHIRPEGTSIDLSMKEFVKQVKEKTEGRVNIEIYLQASSATTQPFRSVFQ